VSRANLALGLGAWLAFTLVLYWLSSADSWQARADDALNGKRLATGPGSATALGAMPGLLPLLEPPRRPAPAAPPVVATTSSDDEPRAEEPGVDEPEDEELEPLATEQPPLVLRGVPLRTVVRGARRGTPMDPVFVRADEDAARKPRTEPSAAKPAPAAIAPAPIAPAPPATVPAPKPVEFPPAPWEVASVPRAKAPVPLAKPIEVARAAPAPTEIARAAPPPPPEPAPSPAPKPAPAPIADARGLTSCEAARDRQQQEIDLSRPRGPSRDGWQDRARELLADGSYFAHCGLSSKSALTLCTAVEQGKVIGVTVTTEPASRRVNACVRSAVAGLRFTASSEIEIFTTYFAPVR
jgi:hypothetical protein